MENTSCSTIKIPFTDNFEDDTTTGYVCVKIFFVSEEGLSKHYKTISSRIEKDLLSYFIGSELIIHWRACQINITSTSCSSRINYIFNGSKRFIKSYKGLKTSHISHRDITYTT